MGPVREACPLVVVAALGISAVRGARQGCDSVLGSVLKHRVWVSEQVENRNKELRGCG